MPKIAIYLTILFLVGAQSASADTLTIGKKEHEGTFKGFSNNIFEFELKDGKTLKTNRTKVKALILDKPAKASYQQRGKKEVDDAQLLRYEKFKFAFKGKSKDTTVMGSVMKHVTKAWSYAGTGGGMASSDTPTAIPPLDLSGTEGAELTPEQATTLAAYKTARAAYDNFLNESTTLVQQMNTATGQLREEIITKLRTRKQDEQAIKASLQEAMNATLATFPKPGEEAQN